MTFMNEYDIDDALGYFRDDPIVGPAVVTLDNLRRCVDRNSDGWAYWPKPTRAAAQLMELIGEAQREYRYSGETTVTAAQVRKAYGPIKAFLTRSGLTCEIVSPS